MSNPYYNYLRDLLPFTRVRSNSLDEEFTLIEQGFDKINPFNFSFGGTDTGTVNAYVVGTGNTGTLVDLQIVAFAPLSGNTGASTLNLDSNGADPIVTNSGQPLQAGDLIAGVPVLVVYDLPNTRWVLIGSTHRQTIAALRPGVITDSSTARTLSVGDENNIIRFTNGGAITVTVPTEASEPFEAGSIIHLHQEGAGQITVASAVGVSLRAAIGLRTRVQYSSLSLVKVESNTWNVIGDQAA